MSNVRDQEQEPREPRIDVPVEDAARALVAFMCCSAGEEFVDRNLLRPFGFTLEPGPVVRSNHNLADALLRIELELDELANRHLEGTVSVAKMVEILKRTADYARRQRENNPDHG